MMIKDRKFHRTRMILGWVLLFFLVEVCAVLSFPKESAFVAISMISILLIYLLSSKDLARSISKFGFKARTLATFIIVFLVVGNVHDKSILEHVRVYILSILWGIIVPLAAFRLFKSYIPPER